MGRYINSTSQGQLGPSALSKLQGIIADGGVRIAPPTEFQENLVCVVDNGIFGAAGYAYDKDEFDCFNHPSDKRPKAWLIWDKVKEYAF